jgi:threonyl-tRNA synthetase
MAKVRVKLEKEEEEFTKGVTALEVLKEKAPEARVKAVAVKINGALSDLTTPIMEDAVLEFVTFDDREGKEIFWHSAAHLMAEAVLELFPDAKPTIGPPIEEGFYYDFDASKPFTPEDLKNIEKKMYAHAKSKEGFERKELSRGEALKLFSKNPYKTELIKELPEGEKISVYTLGSFTDLCRGPHVASSSLLKATKLLKVSGAYWRGNEKNRMLQRIYGISFPEKETLKEYVMRLEEAKKRNHLRLGRELDLFSMHDEAPGVAFFHPKGMSIWNTLMEFWRKEHFRRGYTEVSTPVVLKKSLWVQSGHWEHYKDNMYFTEIDKEEYAVKPMNCPGHILIYRTKRHSYRDFPIRMAETGTVHRHELSGVLNGLFRVRKFTQDDAHIFCLEEQIEDEVRGVIELVDYFYRTFNFDYHVELSTMPEKAMGSREIWEKATKALKNALRSANIEYRVNEGDGAFYGPKIDFHIKDSLGRTWQCATVQLDFLMPENFDLTYIGADDKPHRPVMLHRVVFGSLERFIGILIEHYAGKFPLWLSPKQVVVFPISEAFTDYAEEVHRKLVDAGIKSVIDLKGETVSAKVRYAQLEKANYVVVVGEKEKASKSVTVRNREGKLEVMKTAAFMEKLAQEIAAFA